MRTTVDIDEPILKDLKRLQKREGKSLGRLISDLLSQALGQYRPPGKASSGFRWIVRDMGARVDIADREAVYSAMEERPRRRSKSRAR